MKHLKPFFYSFFHEKEKSPSSSALSLARAHARPFSLSLSLPYISKRTPKPPKNRH